MNSKSYQNEIGYLLQNYLHPLEVKNEWIAFRNFPKQYSPRVDIAVGPFNIDPYNNQTSTYNDLLDDEKIRMFLREVYNLHKEHCRKNEISIPDFENLINNNQNARCFLAIEIEYRNTKKHVMGSIVNATSLGRVGIGVAYDSKTLTTFFRILKYLAYLKAVEKTTYDTSSFLIVTKEQLLELVTKII